ncbi:MAG: serine/threonine protein kinase [bacterium JZ-2024 1]
MSLLFEGQIVRGTYEVERFLGEGAFAEVYRVKHRFLGRQAMKVLKIAGMTVDEIEQYLEEAILLSRIGHPNIIRVFDANVIETSKGMYGFFTMEYVAGGTLEQFWRSYGNQFVPVDTAVEILRQACRGMAVAHSANPPIIHRDIKPSNILVGYDVDGLRVRVSDFGLAKRVNPMTLTASAKGTLCFKPPEVFRDFRSDSCAGDVWALGSILYFLLTDRLPFVELCDSDMDLFDGKRFERPLIPPSRLNFQVDPALDQIVFKALALNPQDRYPTAKEFLNDLSKWKPTSPRITKQQWKARVSSDALKNALGSHSPINQAVGENMARQALMLSLEVGKLAEAADLMEEAFNKWPELRQRYEDQVKLWRRGISM